MACGKRMDPGQMAVALTGCDSGIGAMTAKKLHELGFVVFAGCLTDKGSADLSAAVGASPRLHCLKLDVTSSASIQAFHEAVSSKLPSQRLYALVNNAGIFASGMVDWLSMETFRSVMEVNFFGVVAMCKAFLPQLMPQDPHTGRRGRIINMSSAAGTVAGPTWAPYHASKFALEGFSDTLRREMAQFGVHVSLLEPSFLRTPIIENSTRYVTSTWEAAPQATKERWGKHILDFWVSKARVSAAQEAEPAELAVRDIVRALEASKPRLRYRPNWRSRTFYYYITVLPQGFVDGLVFADTKYSAPPHWATAAHGQGQGGK